MFMKLVNSQIWHMFLDSTLSTGQSVSGINQTSVQTILMKNKFHPYKIHVVQESNVDSYNVHKGAK